MTQRGKIGLFVAAGIIVCVATCGFALRKMFRNFAGNRCTDSVATETVSPDHTHKIALVEDRCVDAKHKVVIVYLLRNDQVFDPLQGTAEGGTHLTDVSCGQVSVVWSGSQKVLITYPESQDPELGPRNFTEEFESEGIEIEIQTVTDLHSTQNPMTL
jgi:hypothetical protein